MCFSHSKGGREKRKREKLLRFKYKNLLTFSLHHAFNNFFTVRSSLLSLHSLSLSSLSHLHTLYNEHTLFPAATFRLFFNFHIPFSLWREPSFLRSRRFLIFLYHLFRFDVFMNVVRRIPPLRRLFIRRRRRCWHFSTLSCLHVPRSPIEAHFRVSFCSLVLGLRLWILWCWRFCFQCRALLGAFIKEIKYLQLSFFRFFLWFLVLELCVEFFWYEH